MPDKEFDDLVDELLEDPIAPTADNEDPSPEDQPPENDDELLDQEDDQELEGDSSEGSEDEGDEGKPSKEGTPDTKKLSDAPEDDKANKAFAEMRAKNTKYERALKRAADLAGQSVDEFLANMEEKAINKEASKQGVDPAVLKRIQALEAENENYRNLQVEVHLQSEFSKLQESLGVSKDELKEFTGDLAQRGHDFRNTSIDYVMLYRGMYHDKLVEKQRQEWITRDKKSDGAPSTVNKKGRNPKDTDGEINTISDLDKLLDSMP